MILVFGGTTEGRKAVEVLEEAGTPYYYSTKTGEQDIVLRHGVQLNGALDGEAMRTFCHEHGISLMVDAAHPFATLLHQTVAAVATELDIPAVRYERIFPARDPDITWIDDYSEIPRSIGTLLATTGVQSIARLKPLEADGMKLYFRILNRESSIALAHKQGARDEQLCYYENPKDIPVEADAILLKESGVTGGFTEKTEAAKARGMKIIALKRPETPETFVKVNGPYGLRRAVEKLLPEFYPLHSGLTTGTCATAAAVAETLRLLASPSSVATRPSEQARRLSLLRPLKGETPDEVPVVLPNGETICVGVSYGNGYASVFKEAGDDPDVTNGLEIRASVSQRDRPGDSIQHHGTDSWIHIEGGEGIGTFTLPGFDYPPGSPAINKVPREMIRQNLKELYERSQLPSLGKGLVVSISAPEGAETARRTFNPRLGIEGGISIIGVSGIVKPFSEEAFIDSIRKCMTVAQASGSDRVVINSGGKSERFVKALYPDLPQQAFVEYGNYIGETLKIAHELAFPYVTLGVMLGKAVKLAAGHLDTHSRKATMDKDFIRQMLKESDCDIDISGITLARELWEMIPADRLQPFADCLISHCEVHCRRLFPNGDLSLLLIDDEGNIYRRST